MLSAAQSGSQFIQLEVREPKMAEGPLVQGLCMFPSASEPGGDGGLSKAEDSLSAESTTAICCEGGFNRYKGVSRRALNVVRQA